MRLLTSKNLDGIISAALLWQVEHFTKVIYLDPKDIDSGSFKVEKGDLIAGLPYDKNASIWFDHHAGSEDGTMLLNKSRGKRGKAPSTARHIFEHYRSPKFAPMNSILDENDRISKANLSMDDVLEPHDWVLLSHTLDHHRVKEDYATYANKLVTELFNNQDIEKLLKIPFVNEKVNQYLKDAETYKERIRFLSQTEKNLIITDLREAELLKVGNRYIIFALYPDQNVHIRLTLTRDKERVHIGMAKSIFNKSCQTHLGKLAEEYGGGGLDGAAGFEVETGLAGMKIREVKARLMES